MPKSAVYFLVTLFLAVTTLTACTPQTRPDAMTVVQERQVLRVGTLMNPTSYYFDHDREQGFEYDLAKRFADRLGVELEMVPRFDINDLFTMLRRGEVDIVAAGIDRTSTRAQLFRFSPPYDVISQKVVFKQGSRQRPRDLQQITDGEIVVVEGSSHHEFLKSLGNSIPTLKWRATSDHDAVELLRMVINEEIDYTITDSTALDIQRRFHPDLSVAFTVKHDQDIGWALPQSNDDSLYAAVIEYFGEIRSSGRLAHIKEQHFGHVKQFNYVTTSLFIEAVDTILPKYQKFI